MADITIKQIMLEVDGELCVASLGKHETNMLLHMLHALSDGPIKVIRTPGLTMVPLSELQEAQS